MVRSNNNNIIRQQKQRRQYQCIVIVVVIYWLRWVLCFPGDRTDFAFFFVSIIVLTDNEFSFFATAR